MRNCAGGSKIGAERNGNVATLPGDDDQADTDNGAYNGGEQDDRW